MKTKIFILLLLFSSQICAQTKVIMVWGDSLLLIKKKVVSDEFNIKDSLKSILSDQVNIKTKAYKADDINLNKEYKLLVFLGADFYKVDSSFKFEYNPLDPIHEGFIYRNYPAAHFFEYYEKKCAADIDPLPNGKWHLILIDENENYILISEKVVKNKLLDGKFIFNYDNGNCRGIRYYRDGFIDSSMTFYKSGALLLKASFLGNCNKYNYLKSYYESGEVLSIFDHSILKEIHFYKSGNISSISNLDWYGISEGECRDYSENGFLKRKQIYKDGRLISEKSFK